jgi:protein-tyrosine phosphatase
MTLRELARVAENLDPGTLDRAAAGPTPADRLAALVPLAISRRGGHRPTDLRDDDVVDPWRRSESVYRESMRQISEAIERIGELIAR